MSWRIEQATPLALLGELPDSWAQTCFTSPPHDLPAAYLLAVLDEVRRVLRPDGTLWLALTRSPNFKSLTDALKDTRWVQPLPASRIPRGVLLFTKQSDFLFRPFAPPGPGSPQSAVRARYSIVQRPGRGCERYGRSHRAWCVPSCTGTAGIPPREVIEWCIAASTVPCACGFCGAPFKHTGRHKRWQATCTHKDAGGRNLVIDPFCATGETGIIAVRHDRQYLGITTDPAHADTARKRIAKLLEPKR